MPADAETERKAARDDGLCASLPVPSDRDEHRARAVDDQLTRIVGLDHTGRPDGEAAHLNHGHAVVILREASCRLEHFAPDRRGARVVHHTRE